VRVVPGGREIELESLALASFVEVARHRAGEHSPRAAYTFLSDRGEETATLTFAALDRRARSLGAELARRGARGERVLLLYPAGLELIAGFLGCLYAGAIAVPCFAPRPGRGLARLRGVVADARPCLALTTAALRERVAGALGALTDLAGRLPELLASDLVPDELADTWRAPDLSPDHVAFLQYTSGSTAAPRGVMITHGNLLANEQAIAGAFGQSETSVVVSWLPLDHDMGLIGGALQPLWSGGRAVLFSPLAFLARPRLWLEAISRYRATTSGGPDFAYALCAHRIPPAERAGLDLASWEVAFNGAEPVRAATLDRFAEAFGPCGFRRSAFVPCYGLAEATLLVTARRGGGEPTVRPDPGSVAPLESGVRISCGRPWSGEEVTIVDPDTAAALAPEQVGEVWVAGPAVAAGYWGLPEASAETFGARLSDGSGPWLRTGDLGFLAGGELFVTGRRKDLLIVRGRNVYPQDLEASAEESHPALRPGGGAAFGVEVDGEERVVVVHELERRREAEAAAAAAAVRDRLLAEHEVAVHAVVPLRAGALPRTTSGKVRRSACRAAWLAGALPVLAAAESVPTPAIAAGGTAAAVAAWAGRLLGRPGIDLDLPLRLDSLQAVELRNRLEAELGAAPPLELLLAGASPRELAAALPHGAPSPGMGLARAADGELLLSPGQQALWMLQQMAPDSAVHNLAVAARLEAPGAAASDPAAVERALEQLVARHPALRTLVQAVDGAPRPCPAPVGQMLDFAVVDAAGWTAGELADRLAAEAVRPFDLARGPLVRARLFEAGERLPVLFLATHHIAADFWSLELLLADFGRLLAGEPLPPPFLGPTDFVLWQRERLRDERLWEYWQRVLGPSADAPPLDLPADRPRPLRRSGRGVSRALDLSPALADGVAALAAARGASRFAVLLAGFQALLGRLTGRDELLIGVPMAGRGRSGLEDVVGSCVNLVPVPADLSGTPSLGVLVDRARRALAGALSHQDLPFPLLVERLQPERDAGRAPLVQAVLSCERPRGAVAGDLAAFALALGGELGGELGGAIGGCAIRLPGGARLAPLPLPRTTSELDLELAVAELAAGPAGRLTADADLCDPATVERLAGQLLRLFAAGLAEPAAAVADLPLLAAAERAQILREWNDSAAPLPDGRIEERILAWAHRIPDSAAVVDGGRVLSYGELARRVSGLTGRLRALGAGPEAPVAVHLGRSAEHVVAVLAALAAGAPYVPLDPEHPPGHLAFLLADSGAVVRLTVPALAGGLAAAIPGPAVPAIALGPDTPDDAGTERAPPAPGGSDDLAYLIYTSGSTGRPKGVGCTHRGVLNLLAGLLAEPPILPGERCSWWASPSFDASVYEMFTPLLGGGTVAPVPDDLRLDGGRCLAWMVEQQIVSAYLPPFQVPALAAAAEQGGLVPPFTRLLVGVEPLAASQLAAIAAALPTGSRMVNGYGPTEITVCATSEEVGPRLASAPGPAAIGRPLRNLQAYLLDAEQRPVPAGVAGEIWLGGVGVARGYWRDPARTAERFTPDPWAGAPGARLYRTGDLARRLPDGRLLFAGRADRQIKVRGVRLEPGAVEALLRELPAVRDAVVDKRGDRLVAWVVTAGEEEGGLTVAALRSHLAAHLPAAMVPAAFVRLDALPLTVHGKIDRRALPPPATPAPGAGSAPRSALERRLAALVAGVLGVERVGVDQSFFELGGHSLQLAQVHARLAAELGLEVPMITLFQHPTIAGLAAHLAAADPKGAGGSQESDRNAAAAVRARAAARRAAPRRRGR
jgi:amino acid adenylation domain-containing protein